MYSGTESTDSQKCTQWAMNPAAYQNTPNDQVDWAALAQQWIIMKEAGPPPIPGDSQQKKHKKDALPLTVEGGEAEMDVESEKEDPPSWGNVSGIGEAPPAPGSEAWNSWHPPANPSGQNWNWNNSWNSSGTVPPPPNIIVTKPPLLPTPNRVFPDSASDNAMPYSGYNTTTQSSNNDHSGQPTFWTGMAVGKITQTEIKPHNKRYSKVNVPTKVTIITPASGGDHSAVPAIPDVPPPILDTNKRKQLPAWIREGLEKMERDKLKQLEKEKEQLVNDEIAEKLKQEEKEKMEILRHTIKEKNLLRKSRFDSDNENSEGEGPIKVIKKASPPPPVPLTPEELMLKVRKSMTEILLKVTNDLIQQVCTEERQRYLKKRKALDQLASAPSGALIKAKLGLGAYDGGSSSSEESEDEDRKDDKFDSDAELRESIKRRQSAFSKTEQEIKDRLAEVERKRGRSRSTSSRSSSADSRNNDSQVEQANIQENASKRPNDSPSEIASSASSIITESKPRRRSSSSSHDSDRKSSRRRSRSSSAGRSSKRDRSVDSYKRRDSLESKKRSRRSRSDSRHSKRSRRSRSHSRSSYSSRKSKRSSRRSRSRSRSYDRKYKSSRSYESPRNRKYRRSRSRSDRKKSRRSTSRSRRSRSRSSSRGKRSRRR